MRPAQLFASLQSPVPLSTSKLGPSGADSQVSGFVYILGPCGSLQRTLLWGSEFLPLPQLPQVFSVGGFEALFPCPGTLSRVDCLAPQLFLPVYPHTNVGLPSPPASALPSPPAPTSPTLSSSHHLAGILFVPAACLHPSYRSGWMFVL